MKATRLTGLLAGCALAVIGTMAGPAAAAPRNGEPVKIGWTAWSDAEFVTKLARKLIEDDLGTKVKLVQTDIAPQYQGIARGDIDAMMMAWLPKTHADYFKRVGSKVVTLGVLYTDARLGWVVPDYVPKDQLGSIADLKKAEVRKKLDGKIQGIDAGSGLMRLSHQAVKKYDLKHYNLITASGAAMVASLDRAIRHKDWIVVTGWSPHWMFSAYKLRYLKDPKGVLGGTERIYALSRRGFQQDHPKVAKLLMRMYLPLDELQAAMYDARQTSYEKAVDKYVEEHPARVHYWLTGETGGKAAADAGSGK